MAYTIVVGDDNSLYGTHKEKIIQKEKLFNKLWFLVAPYYNEYDMSQCVVTLRYLLPISREFKTETLVLSDENYKEYLKYILPVDTNLTKEWGDIELNLTFTMLDTDKNGNIVQRVRKTTNYKLNVIPIPDWDSIVIDDSLMAIDQRILKTQAQINELVYAAEILNNNMADDLVYNDAEETLQLSSKGKPIGKGVSTKEILEDGTPVVDLDSTSGGGSDIDHGSNCNCGCNCEDDVVEFGYSATDTIKPTSDDDVVEF